MSNVGYDLDTSGGLMPLIRALIKPPDEEGNGQKAKKPQHPYYKRPGKGHNHDSCDACGEGGDLICCDRCPASFHLGCYDPPLEENDIPAGLWLCRECKASDAEKPASSRGSRAVSPADSKSDSEKKTRLLRTRSNSKKKSKDESDEEEEEKKEAEEEPALTPMEVLVRAARIMNPTQFELPKQMQVPCIFPGTDKEGGAPAVLTADAAGCVPLPARACFVCQQTCKLAPLLHCDYCPLLFHLDCLDPPLTALPTGRWMCPNHVEKYIDWKLVDSASLSERAALWDRFQAPVDQHAIKIDFIRRARTRRPMFRMKLPLPARARVLVPGMVRAHYAAPAPLLPSRREHVRCTNALKRLKASGQYSESSDEEAAKHTVCLNLACPEYRGAGDCEHSYTRRSPEPAPERPPAEGDDEVKMELSSDCSSSLSDSDLEYLTAVKRRRRSRSPAPRVRAGPGADELLARVDRQLRQLDHKLVRILAWQRLQQVLAGERAHGSHRGDPESSAAARLVADALCVRRAGRALPSELLSATDRARVAAAVWGPPRAARRPRAAPPPARGGPVRATVCPARLGGGDVASQLVCMRLSQLTVGTDGACDVRLDPACRAVSPRHAVIYIDEVSRHFELLNYSEHGSVVNGVRYACDVTASAEEPPARPELPRRARAAPPQHRVNGALTAAGARGCRCGAAAAGAAWEGSALVPHGALLQFGCHQYVFSITDALQQQ